MEKFYNFIIKVENEILIRKFSVSYKTFCEIKMISRKFLENKENFLRKENRKCSAKQCFDGSAMDTPSMKTFMLNNFPAFRRFSLSTCPTPINGRSHTILFKLISLNQLGRIDIDTVRLFSARPVKGLARPAQVRPGP